MPYNNTPIAPSADISGQVALPLARVQKIIAADVERTHVSKNASFAIALATEMFIQHLATSTHTVVKTERKPRRNIQYRDVAAAVAKTDNLQFLEDVVPRTMLYKEFRVKLAEKERAAEAAERERERESGTAVAAGVVGEGEGVDEAEKIAETPEAKAEAMEVDGDETESADQTSQEPDDDDAAMQIEMELRGSSGPMNGARASVSAAPSASPAVERRSSGFTAVNSTR